MTVPLCFACQRFRPKDFLGTAEICRRPTGEVTDAVYGTRHAYETFSLPRERASDRSFFGREKCGPSGRFFTPRGRPPPPCRK